MRKTPFRREMLPLEEFLKIIWIFALELGVVDAPDMLYGYQNE